MTIAIETSTCAQLESISQSFQPMPTEQGSRGERDALYPWVEVPAPGEELNQFNLWHSKSPFPEARLGQETCRGSIHISEWSTGHWKSKSKHHHPRSVDNLQDMIFQRNQRACVFFTACSGSAWNVSSVFLFIYLFFKFSRKCLCCSESTQLWSWLFGLCLLPGDPEAQQSFSFKWKESFLFTTHDSSCIKFNMAFFFFNSSSH